MTKSETLSRAETDVNRSVNENAPEPGVRDRLVKLVTDPGFIVRAIRYALRLPVPMPTEDRRVLEQVIFPFYAAMPEVRKVLFVGCQWYTRHYNRAFFPKHEFWTIEPSIQARRFGARRHVVGPLEELDRHFAENYFDLIICNGVYGFGLDSADQIEAALSHCYTRLRPGGHFIFGWTDVPARTPVPLEKLANLKRFTRVDSPLFGTWRYVTKTPYAHTYDFYSKDAV